MPGAEGSYRPIFCKGQEVVRYSSTSLQHVVGEYDCSNQCGKAIVLKTNKHFNFKISLFFCSIGNKKIINRTKTNNIIIRRIKNI